jgi:hypothetical protein
MRRSRWTTLVFAALALAGPAAFAGSASAERFELKCEPHDVGGPAVTTQAASVTMTLAYDGDASGTLMVTGPFGEMTLPASKESRSGTVEGVNDGKSYIAVGIRAAGSSVVLMPSKAAVEACVAGKLSPEDAKDADLAFMAAISCTGSAAQGANPVPVNASVEIALTSNGPGQWEILTVYMKRTFVQPSTLPGGKITVESDPRCEIVKM